MVNYFTCLPEILHHSTTYAVLFCVGLCASSVNITVRKGIFNKISCKRYAHKAPHSHISLLVYTVRCKR